MRLELQTPIDTSGHIRLDQMADGGSADTAEAQRDPAAGAGGEVATGHKHQTRLLLHTNLTQPLIAQSAVVRDQRGQNGRGGGS